MSDAYPGNIDTGVLTLVRLCGYTPDDALAELTAFSHREKAGLIPITRALDLLVRTTPSATVADSDSVAATRRRWRAILRESAYPGLARAA